MSSSTSTARCVLKNERRNQNLPGLLQYATIATTHKAVLAGVMREAVAFVSNFATLLFFSPSFLRISYVHAASRLFPWSMELLEFASRQFAPKSVDFSVRFSRSHFVHSSL